MVTSMSDEKTGRGERIRTSGPCLPKTVLYQAELLPDRAARDPWVTAKAGRSSSRGYRELQAPIRTNGPRLANPARAKQK